MVSFNAASEKLNAEKHTFEAFKKARQDAIKKNPGIFNTSFLRKAWIATLVLGVTNLLAPTIAGSAPIEMLGLKPMLTTAAAWINSGMYAAAGLCAFGLLNKMANSLAVKAKENRLIRYQKMLENTFKRTAGKERNAAIKRFSRGEDPFPDTPMPTFRAPTPSPGRGGRP